MSRCSLTSPQQLQEGKHFHLPLVLPLPSGSQPQLHIRIVWRSLNNMDTWVPPPMVLISLIWVLE